MSLMVSVNIICETAEQAVRVAEVLSRTAVGLGLEGFYASMNMSTTSDEEEESRPS